MGSVFHQNACCTLVLVLVLVNPWWSKKHLSFKATVLCLWTQVFHQGACCTCSMVPKTCWTSLLLLSVARGSRQPGTSSGSHTCSLIVQGFLVSTTVSPNTGRRYNNAHQCFQYITNHSRYMKYCSGILGPFASIALFLCVSVCLFGVFFLSPSSPLPH